jgi:hypothetical protein
MTTAPDTKPRQRRKRAKRPTDSKAYSAFMVTMSRNFEKRVKDDGIDALAGIAAAQAALDAATQSLVDYLRSEEGGKHTWESIGEALGMKKQSAYERFGKK